MHMKKNVWQFVIGLLLAVGVIVGTLGCSPNITKNNASSVPMKTMTDATGTSIQIPVSPTRIVPIGVSTDDILIPLVGTSRIMAISSLSSNFPEANAEIKGRVTSTTEAILSYSPDVVIAPDWISPNFIAEMRSMSIAVYVYKTPQSIADMKSLIGQLAQVVGEEKKGAGLIAIVNNRLNNLENFLKTIPKEKRKTAIYYTAMGITGGSDSVFDDMSKYAGVYNGAAQLHINDAGQLSREDIIKINPDIIFIPSSDYDSGKYHSPESAVLYDDPSLQGVKAIQNKAIYVVDAKWIMSYSQFQIHAIEEMAKDAYGYIPKEGENV